MPIEVKVETEQALKELNSLNEIHAMIWEILNKDNKNIMWLIMESTERTLNRFAELNGHKGVRIKVRPQSLYPQAHWLYYCEPTWFWGKEGSYKVNT